MKFREVPEFTKEFQKLLRKYRTLNDDFELRKEVLKKFPTGKGSDVNQIPGLGVSRKIYKARLMCRSLKGSSLILIYEYSKEKEEITFIEIYFKGDKEVENRERIYKYFS